MLPVNNVRRAPDLVEPIDDGNAAAPQPVGEPAADIGCEHDRPMSPPIEPARDLVDDDLRARSKCERDVGDQNGQTLAHDPEDIPQSTEQL